MTATEFPVIATTYCPICTSAPDCDWIAYDDDHPEHLATGQTEQEAIRALLLSIMGTRR